MTYLNHGAFGATPRPLLKVQTAIRDRCERQPLRFYVDETPPLIRLAAEAVGQLLGARGEDIALVENTTVGVNGILRSVPLQAGDRVVTSDHVYPAVLNTLRRVCAARGAELDLAGLPIPLSGPDEVVAAFEDALTPATRLVVVDHIASASGLVFPVERIVALAHARGIPVLVDGAHAPGMLPLSLPAIGADWYVGNCHKWLCAPKGAAILWANPDRPDTKRIGHPVTSNLDGHGFPTEFDWTGTRDLSAWLTLPATVAFHRWLGPEAVQAWNHDVAVRCAEAVAAATGGELIAPTSMMGSLAATRLPGFAGVDQSVGDRLRKRLWEHERIEVFCPALHGHLLVRVSGQVYVEPGAAERLAEALPRHIDAVH